MDPTSQELFEDRFCVRWVVRVDVPDVSLSPDSQPALYRMLSCVSGAGGDRVWAPQTVGVGTTTLDGRLSLVLENYGIG